MKKYLCLGGEVIGNTQYRDERGLIHYQTHFVPAHRLPELYRIPRNECIFVNDEEGLRGKELDGLLILRPVSSGDYSLPKPEEVRF